MAPRLPGRPARKLARTLIPAFPAFLRLLAGLMRDRRVSVLDRGLVALVVAYVLMPIDLIPDFLGILGLTDDLFLLGLALRRLVLKAGEDVVVSHWTGEEAALRRLLDGLEGLGQMLPRPVRGLLRSVAGRG